jgi:hypothetical protein
LPAVRRAIRGTATGTLAPKAIAALQLGTAAEVRAAFS